MRSSDESHELSSFAFAVEIPMCKGDDQMSNMVHLYSFEAGESRATGEKSNGGLADQGPIVRAICTTVRVTVKYLAEMVHDTPIH